MPGPQPSEWASSFLALMDTSVWRVLCEFLDDQKYNSKTNTVQYGDITKQVFSDVRLDLSRMRG